MNKNSAKTEFQKIYLNQMVETDFDCDVELSATSENPVQNKVLKGKFDSVGQQIAGLGTNVTLLSESVGTLEQSVGQIEGELTGVGKVSDNNKTWILGTSGSKKYRGSLAAVPSTTEGYANGDVISVKAANGIVSLYEVSNNAWVAYSYVGAFVRKDLLDGAGDVNSEGNELPHTEDLVTKISDSDENVVSSRLNKLIIQDLISRIKNLETITDPLWNDVTLKVENLDALKDAGSEEVNVKTREG